MKKEDTFIIRSVQRKDIDSLKKFFVTAYGSGTIFQHEPFLEWYFNPRQENYAFMKNCIIGVSSDGQIISHYGGLSYLLKVGDQKIPLVWGVNAFTLEEWRGKGINSSIVDFLLNNNETNGVIGFTEKTAQFYNKTGYNIFNYKRFSRYVYILDHLKVKDVLLFLGQDPEKMTALDMTLKISKTPQSNQNIVKINKRNIDDFEINFSIDIFATTHRDKDFLRWRFLDNAFVDYSIYAFVNNHTITAYVACREETLNPLIHKVNRIIDIFGCHEGVSSLLSFIIESSTNSEHIYIDFSMFGNLYNDALLSHNFLKLEGDDSAILPQITAPIGNRANHEYVGLQSRKYKSKIDLLKKENTYFTRMDSDRDRLVKLSQVI